MQKRLRYCFVIVLICSLISGYAASTKRPSGYPGNGLSNSSFPVGQKDTCADPAFLPDSLETVMKKGRLTGPRYYIQDNGGNPGLKFQYTMNASKSLLNAFSISHDHSYLYTAGKDFLISVWTDQNKIMTLKKHSAQINALAPSKDNQYLVSGGMDNQIIIWLLSKGKPVQKIKKVFDSEIRKILITGNDSSFYCTGDNNIVKRYNLYTGRLEKQLLPHEAELSCILYSPDRSFLITGDISGYIRIWDAGSERLLHSIKTENKICDIQIAQNNRSLVCIDAEGFVSIYDFNNYTLLRKQKTDVLPNPVLGIFNKYILVPNSDRKINVLNYENEQIHVLDPEINGVSSFVADVEKNGLFVLTNSGLVGSFRFNMPGLMPYASDIIDDRYFTSDTIAGIKARMRLYTELIVSAKKILVPITSGSEILPRYEEIQKAIKEFEFALGLLDDSDPIRKADQYRQYLLEAYAALSIYDNEKYPEAEEKMSRIAQDVPEAAYPHNTLSILLSRQNRMKDARNAAAKAIEKAPRWTEPHHNLGQIYQKEHDYDKAIKEYEQIIKKDPENTKGYNDLGVINNQLGSYKKAESYFLQSMKLDSLNPATLINFGELQMNRGRFRDAESLFMSSMSLDAGYGRSLLTFGRFYHTLYQNKPKQEYLEKAFDLILEAKNNEPHNPGCYIELVKLLITMLESSDPAADELFPKICTQKPSMPLTHTVWEKILELSDRALSLDPNNTDAYEGIAYVAIKKQDSPHADSLYQAAIEKNPANPQNYYKYGGYLERQGKYDDAAGNYQEAIRRNGKYLMAYLSLWDVYVIQKRSNDLKELYNKAVKVFPDCPVFHFRKAQLEENPDKKEILQAKKLDGDYYFADALLYNSEFENADKTRKSLDDQMFMEDYVRIKKIDKQHIIVKQGDWYGLMHVAGKFILSFEYNEIILVNDTLLLAVQGDQFFSTSNRLFWYDLSGKMVQQPQEYRRATLQNNGPGESGFRYMIVERNGKSGCIDLFGKQIVPLRYDQIVPFDNGNKMIGVGMDIYGYRYGAYNLSGSQVIPLKYERISAGQVGSKKQCCVCTEGGKNHYIDCYGKEN